MCGIFGFVNRTPYTSVLMPFLAMDMLRRGRDSWGVTDGTHIIKKIGPIIDSWHLPSWGKSLIFHTRAGSVGDKVVTNQHPFVFPEVNTEDQPTGKIIVGVHNGGIYNHAEINAKYKRTFPVDSMHVFAHIAEGWPINELRGAGAFVWFETPVEGEPEMHFARCNMYDFHIFRLNQKSLVFCSLRTPVVDTAKLFGWECEELTITPDTEFVAVTDAEGRPDIQEVGKFAVGSRETVVHPTPHHNITTRQGSEAWSAAMCPKCHYGRHYCRCEEYEDDELGTDGEDTVLNFWLDIARTGTDEEHFAKQLAASSKGDCRKCNLASTIHKGTELICPSCLLKLARGFIARENTFVYNW